MPGILQTGGELNISMYRSDDFSFDISLTDSAGVGIDLSNYDVHAQIIPATVGVNPIPIVITVTDASTGKFHLFIGRDTISALEVLQKYHRWEFWWNYPKQQIIPITVFNRTALTGYFNLEDI